MTPFFIAIPFFKNAGFLKETLFSLLDQTDAGWKAAVLDDAIDAEESNSAQLCVAQIGDGRISYHKNLSNLGMAANWNQAFDLASHYELLMILHADDRLRPDYIQEMRRFAIRNSQASAYFCKTVIVGTDGRRVFSFADAYKNFLTPRTPEIKLEGVRGIQKLIPGNFIFCPSILYRVSEFKDIRFRTNLKMVQDFEFISRSLLSGKTWIGYYDHALFEYRRHASNTTANLTENLTRFHEEIDLYRELAKKLEALHEIELAREARRMKVVKLNLLFEMAKSLVTIHWNAFWTKARVFWQIL